MATTNDSGNTRYCVVNVSVQYVCQHTTMMYVRRVLASDKS